MPLRSYVGLCVALLQQCYAATLLQRYIATLLHSLIGQQVSRHGHCPSTPGLYPGVRADKGGIKTEAGVSRQARCCVAV